LVARIGTYVVRVNGVIETCSNTSDSRFKKDHRDRKLKLPEFKAWLRAFKSTIPKYHADVEEKAKESIHALHDIKSLIGSILKTAEELVFDQSGDSIDDKIANTPEELQTIYHSCEVVRSLLQCTDVLVNPEVVVFGKPLERSVHGIFYKLIKVHEKRAQNSGINFRLWNSNNRAKLYSSFLLIPQILIDNAIKHSERNSEIHIKLYDKPSGEIKVDFSSCGDLVPESEQDRIFERSYRGTNAKTTGSGLGLYVAQLVAEGNGFSISYKAEPYSQSSKRGFNHFTFIIPQSAPTQ